MSVFQDQRQTDSIQALHAQLENLTQLVLSLSVSVSRLQREVISLFSSVHNDKTPPSDTVIHISTNSMSLIHRYHRLKQSSSFINKLPICSSVTVLQMICCFIKLC